MRRMYYFGLATAIIVLDQLSKAWAAAYMPGETPQPVEVFPFFNLVTVWNRGVSFGMFNRETDYGPVILIAISLVITLWFALWLMRAQSRFQCAALAIVIGGALGNVIDRLRFGAVFDFLDFHAFGWHWPAFNLADSCIVIGVIMLIGQSFFTGNPGGMRS